MVIGITGTDGAGKGTVVEYLIQNKGFVHYSARAIFIEVLKERQMELTRVNMRLVANEMRQLHGNDFLVTHYMKVIEEQKPKFAVIESIRALAEADTLKKVGGVLLAIDADQQVRYARVQERRSETDKVTFEEFAAHELLEADDPNPHGMQKRKVMEVADYTIFNNGSIGELHKNIEEVFQKLASSAL